MIPENGRTILNLHLNNARHTDNSEYAEECLVAASAIISYACAVNHLTPVEYSNELVMVQLVRAQRKNRAAARS